MTWQLGLILTCLALVAVWLAFEWSAWYVRRRKRHMREVVRTWDSRQDFVHRMAARDALDRAGCDAWRRTR